MQRDHTQLICNISELSGLFQDAQSLQAFLQKIVEMTAEHMNADVCSIYLFYEDTQELVLSATKGLKSSSIGQVKLKLGEGLTGLALQELRSICERQASQNPNFRYFPEIGEELYESFLAVPIVRGQTRIGVMVLQNVKKNYFTEQDIRAFRAVTSQLANTIETAKILMSFHSRHSSLAATSAPKDLKLIKGRIGSEGFAFADAIVWRTGDLSEAFQKKLDEKYVLEDFYRAVQVTERQLQAMQKQIEEKLADVASLIFAAQILMLKDQTFTESIVRLIQEGTNPPQAILKVVRDYVQMFDQVSNAYLREKRDDVRDIGRRILENLTGAGADTPGWEGRIVIAEELLPSDALKLSSQNIKGIILLSGGVSSHLSILARSLQIPLIIIDENRLVELPPSTRILLDAEQGNIYINPSQDVIDSFKTRDAARINIERLKQNVRPETYTKDGTRITLLSNINLLGDLKAAQEAKAEGVGLYRTEFPFIVRSDFPSEEEQFVIYKKLTERMRGKEIIFRTLDIGGDKVLSYYHHVKEENPFLGMRSIRFSLRHKDIFSQQIRAILRAGADTPIKIMFPMISSVDELLQAKETVRECIAALKKEDVAFNNRPDIGIMIELPAAIEIIDELAQESDFFSIGTNDFVQYMLAVDRTNEKVADFYLPHHPAILRALKKVVDAAVRYKKDVSICGDMANDERYLSYFLGIGVRKISADPFHLPRIQAAIAALDLPEACRQTTELLKHSLISDTARLVSYPAARNS